MKKILIITYYWPPSGGPGVQRVLNFCKFLPEFGWEPVVLTVENGEFPCYDDTLSVGNNNIITYRSNSISFYNLFKRITGKSSIPTYQLSKQKNESLFVKLSRWIRYNLIIPDGRVGWYPYAVKKAYDIVKDNDIGLIFSSGPPHSVHLIAKRISRKSLIPWVADFRDPWSDRFVYEENTRMRLTQLIDKYLERSVLFGATRIITVSPGFRYLLSHKNEFTNKINIVYNGYDESDFDSIDKASIGTDNTIIIGHMGTLSKSQCPTALFRALKALRKKGQRFKYQLNLIGNTHPDILNDLANYDLTQISIHYGYLPHVKALKILSKSTFLFLVIPKTSKNSGHIPGKIFEYIRLKIPIILIGPPDGDAASIIRKTHSGFAFDYDDVDSIKKILTSNPTIQPKDYQVFNRRNLTKQLVAIFNAIV